MNRSEGDPPYLRRRPSGSTRGRGGTKIGARPAVMVDGQRAAPAPPGSRTLHPEPSPRHEEEHGCIAQLAQRSGGDSLPRIP